MALQLTPEVFATTKFDRAACVGTVVAAGTVRETLAGLSQALTQIEEAIAAKVGDNYDQLLEVAGQVGEQGACFGQTNEAVRVLEDEINGIHSAVEDSYLKIKSRATQASRMHTAASLLQKVMRFSHLAQKLKQNLQEGTQDYAKAAICRNEIETLLKENKELSGIALVEHEVSWFNKVADTLEVAATLHLKQGLELQNHSSIAKALEVFAIMSTLPDKVSSTMTNILGRVSLAMGTALYVQEGRAEDRAADRVTFIGHVSQAMEDVHAACVQAWSLCSVLQRTPHPLTHVPLSDCVPTPASSSLAQSLTILQLFWRNMCKLISDKITDALNSRLCCACLLAEFPRIYRMFQDLAARLARMCSTFDEEKQLFLGCTANVEAAYPKFVYGRLLELHNVFFSAISPTPSQPQLSAPSKQAADALQAFAQGAVGEIDAVKACDSPAAAAVAHSVASITKMYLVKTRELISDDPESASQQALNQNTLHFHCLIQVQAVLAPIEALLVTAPAAGVVDEWRSTLRLLVDIAERCVAPVFAKHRKALEITMLRMHGEDFSGDTIPANEEHSDFMLAIDQHVCTFRNQYLCRLPPCPIVSRQLTALCARVVELFIRNAALLRPLGTRGKLRLANDMAHLIRLMPKTPAAVAKAAQSLRQLFHMELNEIESWREVHALLPSVIMHHLLGRGPAEMLSPHTFAKISVAQFNEWLDSHTDEEQRWEQVKTSLDAYAVARRRVFVVCALVTFYRSR
eukprot:TRINITY_DN4748_c0_g1_i3.p1 TRINITY_DN4748_c0_g1~~TRINITY_DN4748_c0_g1_i3.p1  ORF type:complete len:754 (+),score=191.51 TRINITY_DN4748_c0_g1_i3:32-2263(+)